jgi:hypothetical protein
MQFHNLPGDGNTMYMTDPDILEECRKLLLTQKFSLSQSVMCSTDTLYCYSPRTEYIALTNKRDEKEIKEKEGNG